MRREGFSVALFDGDGTLFDSMASIHSSGNSAFLDVLGRPLAIEVLHQFGGHNLQDTLFLCAGGAEFCDAPTLASLVEAYIHYDRSNDQLILPYPGVVEMLRSIRLPDIKLGINTNRGAGSLSEILGRNKMFGIFDLFVTGDTVERNKPDPESINLALDWLGHSSREDVIMIGDTDKDINCGKAAGVKTAAVPWGHMEADRLQALTPDFFVRSVDRLVPLIIKGRTFYKDRTFYRKSA
jgi:phosphoglycolate phosphatase-like HAD superfamily hydrolase